jgi:hypothetical protein
MSLLLRSSLMNPSDAVSEKAGTVAAMFEAVVVADVKAQASDLCKAY